MMTSIVLILVSFITGWLARDFLAKRVASQDNRSVSDAKSHAISKELNNNTRKQADTEKVPIYIGDWDEVEEYRTYVVSLSYGSNEADRLRLVMGYAEMQQIVVAMDAMPLVRPLPFDLFQTLMRAAHFSVKEIVIDALIDQLFYGTVVLQSRDGEFALDARPADALVIALKNKAPMYVYNSVIETYLNPGSNKV
jgi:bifunctional DNase/RNase